METMIQVILPAIVGGATAAFVYAFFFRDKCCNQRKCQKRLDEISLLVKQNECMIKGIDRMTVKTYDLLERERGYGMGENVLLGKKDTAELLCDGLVLSINGNVKYIWSDKMKKYYPI